MTPDYRPANDVLKDRVILVTGAGDGIGRAAALGFAAHGATVILLGKTIGKLESVYDEIESAGGPMPAIYPMHLEGASPYDYGELASSIDTNFKRLDGILHNAANLPYLSRIKDYEADDWMKVMQVNLNAPFLLTQACMPLLEQADDASVLFTVDSNAHDKAFWGAYGVSKVAVHGLMHTLSAELERSTIRFNSIDPGATLTALRKKVFPAEQNTALKQATELLPLYLWAIGPDSRGTTGQLLRWSDIADSASA